jgi:transporter family-2 protein
MRDSNRPVHTPSQTGEKMNLSKQIIPLLLAALSGSLMAIQGTFNSALGKAIGFLEGTLVVHVIGTLVAGLLVLLVGNGHFSKASEAPWYTWLGGAIGVVIVLGVIASISKLGVGFATTGIVAAQLFTAYLIDHFGWCGTEKIPFNLCTLGGILLIAAGTKLLLK